MEEEKQHFRYPRKFGKKTWKKKQFRGIPKTISNGSITAWVGDRVAITGNGVSDFMYANYGLTTWVNNCPEFTRLRNMYPNFKPIKYSASVYCYPSISQDQTADPYTCKTVNLNFNASSFASLGSALVQSNMLDDINCKVAPPGEKIKVKKIINPSKNQYVSGDLAVEQWGYPLLYVHYDNNDSSLVNGREIASIFWRVKFIFSNQFVQH